MQAYESLVRKVQEADGKARDDAFGDLIVQFDSIAQGWAYNLLGDVHAAQDVVQRRNLRGDGDLRHDAVDQRAR